MATIEFRSVSKSYGTFEAVSDLNLSCAEGEMLALLGPSGCGKSTTLKMAAGIESISDGEIYFGDRPVSRLSPGKRNIAMVFEDYGLYPHLSIRENIAFPLRARGTHDAAGQKRIGEVLALLGLEAQAENPVRGMSGGAMQRVAIGRALVRDPNMILFDEPLSHLDADQKIQLRTEIKRLQKLRGITSILVTHDQTEAIAMADRIAVMNHGVLQQVGQPQDLYERPVNLFVARFIGEPPLNLLPVREHTGDAVNGAGWQVGLGGRALPAGASSLIMGIRPEHISLAPATPGVGTAEISYREPRGDVDVLTMRFHAEAGDGDILVAEIPGPSGFRAGDCVRPLIPTGSVLIFDAESGLNLEDAA